MLEMARREHLVDKVSPDPHASLAGMDFRIGASGMPEYGDLLIYLASHPPEGPAERRVHASMLELIAACMRDDRLAEPVELAALRARYDSTARAESRTH